IQPVGEEKWGTRRLASNRLCMRSVPARLVSTSLCLSIGLLGTVVPPAVSSARRSCPAPATARPCGLEVTASVPVSDAGGLGQIEIAPDGKLAAVVQRDEGIVATLDIGRSGAPKVIGRFDDGAVNSFDGDLAFSHDGGFLFYARQTHQFSGDGIHVLDVSDPTEPAEVAYQPQGGTLRIAYYFDGAREWVISLDAIHGLVINLFDRTTGQLVPVHVDPLPLITKVGGPASAGIVVDPDDPKLGVPLLYVAAGQGLDVFDLSDPVLPQKLGSWSEQGLADIEVVATPKGRTVYAASEYWFRANTPAEIVVLDASSFDAIEERSRWGLGRPPEEAWRVQGMEYANGALYVAHSTGGLMVLDGRGRTQASVAPPGKRNEAAGVQGSPYAMDVEVLRSAVLLTDAATGALTVLRRR
ncbi:MAG: hypothetical protein M3345_02905, partial [Actinomycetota bacterium]|nr:hypothetical protein [Actinomycetota bacterium]